MAVEAVSAGMTWAGVQQPAGGVRGHFSPSAGAGAELGMPGQCGAAQRHQLGWGLQGSPCSIGHPAMRSLRPKVKAWQLDGQEVWFFYSLPPTNISLPPRSGQDLWWKEKDEEQERKKGRPPGRHTQRRTAFTQKQRCCAGCYGHQLPREVCFSFFPFNY